MSKVGTAKSEGIGAFFRMLFRTEETNINSQAETLEEIQPTGDISSETIEELKNSEKRVASIAEKYRIEKFEVASESPKIKNVEVTKETNKKSKKQKEAPKVEKQELEQEGEERE